VGNEKYIIFELQFFVDERFKRKKVLELSNVYVGIV
jgi:hypothetical protein